MADLARVVDFVDAHYRRAKFGVILDRGFVDAGDRVPEPAVDPGGHRGSA